MPSGPAALVGSRLKRGSAYEIPFNIGIVARKGVSNFGTIFSNSHFSENTLANERFSDLVIGVKLCIVL